MSTTTIREILGNRPVHSVTPGTRLRQVAQIMAEHRVGALAILDGARLAGIVTERDIVFRAVGQGLHSDDTDVEEVMTPDPVTVDIDAAVADTLRNRLGEAFRHLPVMEGERLAGILSYRDIPAEYIMLYERFREMSGARADEATPPTS
jgi:CBS domain-containing protein